METRKQFWHTCWKKFVKYRSREEIGKFQKKMSLSTLYVDTKSARSFDEPAEIYPAKAQKVLALQGRKKVLQILKENYMSSKRSSARTDTSFDNSAKRVVWLGLV